MTEEITMSPEDVALEEALAVETVAQEQMVMDFLGENPPDEEPPAESIEEEEEPVTDTESVVDSTAEVPEEAETEAPAAPEETLLVEEVSPPVSVEVPEVSADLGENPEVAALREQITQLAQTIQEQRQAMEEQEQAQNAPAFEDFEFVSEEQFEDVLTDRSRLNVLLNDVHKRSVALAREQMLKEAPRILAPLITNRVEVSHATRQFYDKNPDLVGCRDYVKIVAGEISAKNPAMEYPELLSVLAGEVRSRLGAVQARSQGRPGVVASSLPKPAGTRRPSPKQLSKTEREIAALIALQ